MTNETFDRLPSRLQIAYVLGLATEHLGREMVERLYRGIRPLGDDLFGHAHAFSGRASGEAPDPATNYWQGAWQIYDAD